MGIEDFAVGPLETIYYVESFLTGDEQANLLREVRAAPAAKWKALKNRRAQNWGGVVHEKGLIAQPLPAWLAALAHRIAAATAPLFPAPINHVLVNEYGPGQGILPHRDGPLYHPVVAIVSLGAPAVMRFSPHRSLADQDERSRPADVSVLLMPGSLLVFKDAAYEDYLHGIDGKEGVDGVGEEAELLRRTGTRVSLTCRFVSKVVRNFLKL